MPASHTMETVPIRDDANIKLQQTATRRVALVGYSAFRSEKEYLPNKNKLVKLIKKKGRAAMLMTAGVLGIFGCAGERPHNLGAKGDTLAACPASPNCVSSQAVDEQHRIAPLTFSGNPNNAFARLKRVLSQRSDTTIVEEKSGYLRVELRTILFVDDGEFLLDREKGVIQLRSASRLGHSDLGKNRSRMEEIRRQFQLAEVLP